MERIRVVQDSDATHTGDDFLRGSFLGEDAEGTGVMTVIERVVASEQRAGQPWRFRRLFDGIFASMDAALEVALAYARHKGIPVVYTELERRRQA